VGWAFATVLQKVGCFFAGCCDGAPTELPWAVVFPPGGQARNHGVPVHPTQLYDAGAALLVGAALAVAFAYGRARGRLLLVWGLAFAATRFATEPVRSEVRFAVSEHWSAAMIVEVAVMAITLALLVRPAGWDRVIARLDARVAEGGAPGAVPTRRRVMAALAIDMTLALAVATAVATATNSAAAFALAWLGYYVAGNGLLGAAPVARALGFRSARAAGTRPGLARRLLRGVWEAVAPIVTIGLLRPLFDPARRSLADALSGTLLVRAAPR
jgi:hypothetical protein